MKTQPPGVLARMLQTNFLKCALLALVCTQAVGQSEPPFVDQGVVKSRAAGQSAPVAARSVLLSPRIVTWPHGVVPWKYNPAGQPSSMDAASWVALVSRTMGKWERACAVRFDYQGLTTTPIFVDDGVNVVGWSATAPSYGMANSYLRSGNVVPEDVLLFAPSDLLTNEWWTKLVRFDELIEGVLLHELGHLLGLQHSDQPASILYANPYHPEQGYMRNLKPDDRAACAALYGAANLHTDDLPARGAVQLLAGQTARVVVAERNLTPTENATEPSVTRISPNAGAVTISGYVTGMPTGQTMRVELLAPDGSLYDYRNYPSFPQGRLRILVDSWVAGYGAVTLPGVWTVNVLVGDVLKATQALEVPFSRGSLVAAYPEILLSARLSANANTAVLSSRVLAGAIKSYGWALNGIPNQENADLSILLAPAVVDVQLRVRSDKARYTTASNNFPQGEGPDVVSRVLINNSSFVGAARFSAEVLGARSQLTVRANAWMGEGGNQGVYVLATAGDVIVQRTPSGWQLWDGRTALVPYFTTTGPVLTQFPIFQSLDLSGLPAGVTLFVGSGSSFDEMVSSRRYAAVARF